MIERGAESGSLSYTMKMVLRDSTFRKLRSLISETSGIYIPDGKKYLLETRLLKVVEEKRLAGFDEYVVLLRSGANGDDLARLYDAVTTKETYFFRDHHQLDVFVDGIVPEMLEKRQVKGLRLWSAACSTGEEPYTVMMLLRERFPGIPVDCIATDISEKVLACAQKGTYGPYSLKNMPERYLRKYFRKVAQVYELDRAVRRSVRFRTVNLSDESAMRAMRKFDAIFCRNVLIYFDTQAKEKVVSLLYESLNPGGFLFLGTSETLTNIPHSFTSRIVGNVVLYQKP